MTKNHSPKLNFIFIKLNFIFHFSIELAEDLCYILLQISH